jgi:hypothetical protein
LPPMSSSGPPHQLQPELVNLVRSYQQTRQIPNAKADEFLDALRVLGVHGVQDVSTFWAVWEPLLASFLGENHTIHAEV